MKTFVYYARRLKTSSIWMGIALSLALAGSALAQPCTPPSNPGPAAIDPCFVPPRSGLEYSGYNMVLQPDGKIVMGNFSADVSAMNPRGRVARLNTDGTLDGGFSLTGSGISLLSPYQIIHCLALQPDGKIMLGGYFESFDGKRYKNIVRLNANGTLDSGFAHVDIGFDGIIYALASQPDGKMLVGGAFTNFNGVARSGIARLNADGTLDNSFSTSLNFVSTNYGGLALQPDGKVLTVGEFNPNTGNRVGPVVRLNPNGSWDTSFHPAPLLLNCNISTLVLQPNGKVLVGGTSPLGVDIPTGLVARLNADGSLDGNFHSGSSFGFYNGGGEVFTLAAQPDGKVLVGGYFSKFGGVDRRYVARLNADGMLDTSFVAPGYGLDSKVRRLVVQPDGKLLVSGEFSAYNGAPRRAVVRLYATDAAPTPTHHALTASARIFAAPNPASQSFILHGLTAPAALTLHDALGRRVLHTQAHPNQPIPVQGLPPGLYRWRTNTGQAGSVVIQ